MKAERGWIYRMEVSGKPAHLYPRKCGVGYMAEVVIRLAAEDDAREAVIQAARKCLLDYNRLDHLCDLEDAFAALDGKGEGNVKTT
jgi:hypothetical protein